MLIRLVAIKPLERSEGKFYRPGDEFLLEAAAARRLVDDERAVYFRDFREEMVKPDLPESRVLDHPKPKTAPARPQGKKRVKRSSE